MRCLLTMLAVAKALQRALPRAHARRRVISMGLKTGIVGLPNVGKSTLFNALTGDPVFKLKKSDDKGDAAKWSRLDMRVEQDESNKRACAFYRTDEEHTNSSTFFLIRSYAKRQALLGASFGAYKPEEKGEGLNGESMGPQGLVAGHAYSILDAMSSSTRAMMLAGAHPASGSSKSSSNSSVPALS